MALDTECCYTECCKQVLYAECHYAECHYAECYYAECHGASNLYCLALEQADPVSNSSKSDNLNLLQIPDL